MSSTKATKAIGSVINSIMERSTIGMPAPEVGMGATEFCWSDRHVYTIVAVVDAKTIYVTRDSVARLDNLGLTDSGQQYQYTTNWEGARDLVTLRKDGKWHFGKTLKGNVLGIGRRDEYCDPSF